MTKLLEAAFRKAAQLPELEQNLWAKWLLEELASEKKWERQFAASEDILAVMAKEAIQAQAKGKTKKMDLRKL